MPFKSNAQRRFIFANKDKFSTKQIEEFSKHTPQNIPEKLHPTIKVKVKKND